MDSLKLPTTAARANAFMGQGSLSFPTSQGQGQGQGQGHSQEQAQTQVEAKFPVDDVHSVDAMVNNDGSLVNNVKIENPSASTISKFESSADLQLNADGTISKNVANDTSNAISTEDGSASGIVPTLQNIVATVNLDCRLELKTIALHARNAEYNPKRFAAVIMRIREPKTTALIFASGKMVVTGAKSEDDSKLAARKYARIIQKLGFNAKFTDFKIQNIVGSCDVKFPIRLEGLAYAHGTFSSYEPELFPGLIYRMVKPKIVLLIFVSGKIVLTGAKQREEIYKAFEAIYPVLSEFRKN
ncbi:unnamed protein product [Pichia kudriavzevii]